MNDDLVERVARTIYENLRTRKWEKAGYIDQQQYRRDARAAIAVVLEEAAKVAENKAAVLSQYRDTHAAVQAATAQDIAVAIRQLIPRQPA